MKKLPYFLYDMFAIYHLNMAIILGFVLLLCSLGWLLRDKLRGRARNGLAAPEAGGSWPLLGHLPILGGPKPLHIVLGQLADRNGPIFTIKMGLRPALVISNWETAKECLKTNDQAFASRPNSLAMEILGYDRSMFGFIPYGPFWRQIRKIATLELLSQHRLESFKGVRESEIRTSLKELYSLWERKRNTISNKAEVEMKRWFGDITLNVIFRIIVGKSVGYATSEGGGRDKDEGWKQALRDFFDLSGGFAIADAIPFLRWLDVGGQEKAMRATAKKLDAVVTEWLKEHKEAKREMGEGDFMGIMLDMLEDSEAVPVGRDPDTINKVTCLALILAGSDTTSVTLTWALSLMLNHPEVLKKAQQEIDTHVGKERQVQESDVKNLIYLNAIIKETLRLYPAGPLSVPHESMEDCIISGYHIPVGTMLITNLWKIQRDPGVWSDADQFKPERFLTTHKDLDLKGQNFEFIPFGSGRRMCPGVTFALQVLHLTMASLLHGFDFESSSGELVDMTESIGLTNIKATPLNVLITPRLPSHLYE